MSHKRRAVLFDLDDTLYPLRRFILSGFHAVARHVAETHGLDAASLFHLLAAQYRAGDRGYELQAAARRFGLPDYMVPSLVDAIRCHQPSLRLPRSSERVLRELRRSADVAIVTNGFPDVQARKIAALGLGQAVDAVIYATAGGRPGKPHRQPFLDAIDALGGDVHRTVFVGDDDVCDMIGASSLGIRTIHLAPWSRRCARTTCADATARSIAEVPALVNTLLNSHRWSHAA
jgi:putative hydrolase of the HAD superfamily